MSSDMPNILRVCLLKRWMTFRRTSKLWIAFAWSCFKFQSNLFHMMMMLQTVRTSFEYLWEPREEVRNRWRSRNAKSSVMRSWFQWKWSQRVYKMKTRRRRHWIKSYFNLHSILNLCLFPRWRRRQQQCKRLHQQVDVCGISEKWLHKYYFN